jgi:hypothetical protein
MELEETIKEQNETIMALAPRSGEARPLFWLKFQKKFIFLLNWGRGGGRKYLSSKNILVIK